MCDSDELPLSETLGNEPDLSNIRYELAPFRVNYREELIYLNGKSLDVFATRLRVALRRENETSHDGYHRRGNDMQPLSPESVGPSRPLLNGH